MRASRFDPVRSLNKNARVSISTEWLWAVFGTPALYYITVFMHEEGLTPVQIGLIISVSLWLACGTQLVAGIITDRLGRRVTTTVFDVISWVVPMLLWAASSNFWMFLVGFVLNSLSKIVGVSFGLLAVEDSPEPERPRIFAALKLVALLAGLSVPIVGWAIQIWGAEFAFRLLFLCGAITMLLHNIVRHRLTSETRAGLNARQIHRDAGIQKSVAAGARAFVVAVRHPGLWRIIVVYAATSIAFQINVFQALYLGENLRLSPVLVGLFPAIAALASLVCFLVLMPALQRRLTSSRSVALALLITCAGWAMFCALQPHPTLVTWVGAALLLGAGPFMLESYRDAIVVGSVQDNDAATFYATVQSVAAIATIPAALFAGWVFEINPQILFLTILGLYGLSLVIALTKGFGSKIRSSLGVGSS